MRRRAGVIGVLMTIIVVATMVGCPGATFIVQQYPGEVRPPETIATLRVNGNDAVRLLALDEQDAAAPIATDSRLHVEMLPGRHSVTVTHGNVAHALTQTIEFAAEAGKVYRVTFDSAAVARIYEISRGADTLTKDVTAAPTAAPSPSSPRLPSPLSGAVVQ